MLFRSWAVVTTVAAQNDAIRRLVAGHPEVRFVDEAALMPPSPLNFNDACHLTAAGAERFVENLLHGLALDLE